jgi:squalene-hopene/tetraprenyl-beta-curcumene cyclase
MARPLLPAMGPAVGEVRAFVERIVVDKLEAEPSLPPDGISAIMVQVATGLSINDRLTTGKLHPVTRQALDRMWTRQREDGSWEWPFRDVPPIKIDEHYGVTFAAIGAGTAPEGYAETEAARAGLAKIRRYLAAHPAVSLHQRGMLAWASCSVKDLLSAAERGAIAEALLAAQRPDGGWSLASLVETESTETAPAEANAGQQLRELQAKPGYGREFLTYLGRTGAYTSSLDSDGYATGFVIHIARQTGVPADDPRLIRGINWLKQNQRQSGRWFTPSQGHHTRNYITNAGTAYAIMALAACDAVEKPDRIPAGKRLR